MKKILLLSGLAFASMCYGFFYDDTLVVSYNEPITIRIMEVYRWGTNLEIRMGTLSDNYNADLVLTNVVNNRAYYDFTMITNDYVVSLTPNSSGYGTFEMGNIPDSIEVQYYMQKDYRWGERVSCKRIVGYLINGQWIDRSGKDITELFSDYEHSNNIRQIQHNERINPDMQLNSVISMTENTPKISFDIVYSGEKIVWGKKELTDSEWVDVTDIDKSEYRFFKVSLKSN